MKQFWTSISVVLAAGGLMAHTAVGVPSHPVASPSPSQSPRAQVLSPAEKREKNPNIGIPIVMRMQERAWNKGDLKAFMSGYFHSKNTIFTSGGVIVTGWDTVYDRYQKRYGTDPKTMGTLRFENVEIYPLGADFAMSVGQWFLEGADRHGTMDGVFTLIWKHTKDGWKIIHDHTSLRPASS